MVDHKKTEQGQPVRSKRRRGAGRPKGVPYPVLLRLRLSHLGDAFLAYLQACSGRDTDYSTLVRVAINEYAINHPEFNQADFMEVVQDMAHSLRDSPRGLEMLVKDVARVFHMSVESACTQLGVDESMIWK